MIGVLFHCLDEAQLQKPKHRSGGFKRGVPAGGIAGLLPKRLLSPPEAFVGFRVSEAVRHQMSLPAASAGAKRRWFG